VEAWTDRTDLGDGAAASLLATSASMWFLFDDLGFSHGMQFDQFRMADRDPGQGTIFARPTNASMYSRMAKLLTWHGFLPAGKVTGRGLPMFSLDVTLMAAEYTPREFPVPQVNVSFSQPGVYFIGIYGAWSGQYGFNFPAPENGVRTYNSFPLDIAESTEFQPMAIVVPWENGTRAALPANFSGPVHVTKPIPGDWRMALRVSKMTVFNGGAAYIRMIKGVAGGAVISEGPHWRPPQVIELEWPIGLHVVRFGSVQTGLNSTDVSHEHGGGQVSPGYRRIRLNKPASADWMYLNVALSLTVEVEPGLEGKHFPDAKIRAYTGLANQQRADNWQKLEITVEPLVPVRALPKRLHTAFCWSGPDQFVNDATKGLDSITTWRRLGFNTIPGVGAGGATPLNHWQEVLSPANRSGPEWDNISYGVETSPFLSEGFSYAPLGLGSFTSLKMPLSAPDDPKVFNFSRHGLTKAAEQAERTKWRNALEFYQDTKFMDLSYDGVTPFPLVL